METKPKLKFYFKKIMEIEFSGLTILTLLKKTAANFINVLESAQRCFIWDVKILTSH